MNEKLESEEKSFSACDRLSANSDEDANCSLMRASFPGTQKCSDLRLGLRYVFCGKRSVQKKTVK